MTDRIWSRCSVTSRASPNTRVCSLAYHDREFSRLSLQKEKAVVQTQFANKSRNTREASNSQRSLYSQYGVAVNLVYCEQVKNRSSASISGVSIVGLV